MTDFQTDITEELKKRLGEVISIAPWTKLYLWSAYDVKG